MERIYKARYYNGKSSQPFTVDVSIKNEMLVVSYINEHSEQVQQQWNKAHILETEFNSSIITLQYGDTFPYEQLEITDRDFRKEYVLFNGVSLQKRLLSKQGMVVVVGGLVSMLVLAVLAYLFLLPAIVDFAAKRIPKEYEVEIGKSLYATILQNEKIDSQKTESINRFFSQLNVEGDYPVEITVVKSSVTNAFALPGGGIVVYTKILEDMETPEQLAALLSHEYSHVQLKHATRNIFRNLAGSLFISAILGDVSGLTAVILQNAEQLRGLHYTRGLEQEADNNGLLILKNNQLDAEGMKVLFKQLKKASAVDVPELISTHPDLDNRIKNVEQFIADNKYETETNDSLEFYFRQITNEW